MTLSEVRARHIKLDENCDVLNVAKKQGKAYDYRTSVEVWLRQTETQLILESTENFVNVVVAQMGKRQKQPIVNTGVDVNANYTAEMSSTCLQPIT